jgi:hypothetical protein
MCGLCLPRLSDDDVGARLITTVGFGVLNAPVDERCNSSYCSWSFLGRRGGAGPEPKGGVA